MRYPLRFALVLLLAGLGAGVPSLAVAKAKTPPADVPQPLDEARLNQAQMLKDEHRYLEAAAIYEEQLKRQPANAELVARQASMLSSQADQEKKPARAKELRKRARALAERAEKLGTTDPLTPMILASIQPDGTAALPTKGTFSKHEEADKLIAAGEECFRRRDFAKAREAYQRAFELEPTNYLAALWTGDAYLAARDSEPACIWYRKAIAVDPDTETAHRYLGDALEKLGRKEEATSERIAALLCEPYQRLTRQHFTPQLRAVAEAKGRMIPRFPAMQSKIEGKEIKIAYDAQWGAANMAYNICAVGWRQKDFAAAYPQEKAPRRSLREEVFAIGGMLEVVSGIANDKSEKTDPALAEKWRPIAAGLEQLTKDGLLEAYVLFERADEDLAKDFVAYRTEHRDLLERYIRVYWCGFE